MIIAYAICEGVLQQLDLIDGRIPEAALWLDLFEPTPEEEQLVEASLQLDVPTLDEMREIEESARLYQDDQTLFMVASIVTGISERRPVISEVTFVLTREHLVTVRYADPLPFRTFDSKCKREPLAHTSSDAIFASLLEHLTNRIADVLEKVEATLTHLSREIFEEDADQLPSKNSARADLQKVIKQLGRTSTLTMKLRESLLSLNRIIPYARSGAKDWLTGKAGAILDTVERDVRSLTEFQDHVAGEISFLLEATLGLINIEQNRIIKVFSIAAVLFLPPTLVATAYGMNFDHMPELHWTFGYPFALLIMILSATLPYYLFKRNKWL
ncbi:magnesium transporter [Rhodoligotrophos appendicifer]|uniref:magnesium transporter CorA family protein n=1 Tax=Rhodoligotrophos appendicifer TaxID=987056 RepID=UPI00117E4943|nr:magnesium transporter CorA family protein [Rhodoligotrophos appendicifer]